MNKACIQTGEDTVWTLTYVINRNGTVTIHNFDRADNDGYMFAEQLAKLERVVESDGRIVESVIINGQEYEVENKQNVFTYKQPL